MNWLGTYDCVFYETLIKDVLGPMVLLHVYCTFSIPYTQALGSDCVSHSNSHPPHPSGYVRLLQCLLSQPCVHGRVSEYH